MNRYENQTLALAGIFQAAVLVEELAQRGNCDDKAFDASLDSLFRFDAASTLEVFGDLACLEHGLRALVDYLGGQGKDAGRNVAYYVLSMMKIALQLQGNSNLVSGLQDGLRAIETRADEYDMPRANTVLKIDALYQDSISRLMPRIMVRGEQSHLLSEATAARVRSMLLAGIRAAVLWRQLGGNKWKIFFARKKYVAAARRFLQQFQ